MKQPPSLQTEGLDWFSITSGICSAAVSQHKRQVTLTQCSPSVCEIEIKQTCCNVTLHHSCCYPPPTQGRFLGTTLSACCMGTYMRLIDDRKGESAGTGTFRRSLTCECTAGIFRTTTISPTSPFTISKVFCGKLLSLRFCFQPFIQSFKGAESEFR